ncbi:hypothetical protein HMPREF0044_0080 [Gleimia coleocanis DSM 15436]|uniref:Uncharacterized protein n=2 Tax=Gleimia TaxID=2692113 RepID=C0VY40_9ACTO|nr:hypothetical protein HMPREF0044_0080 [Gleimia coleocanis DSM 15436]
MGSVPHPVSFPRADDGFGFAWNWEGQRFTPVYEARVKYIFNAISLFPDWTAAIEFEGSEDGEVIVAYHNELGFWRYLIPIEDPSTHEWVDEMIAKDKAFGVTCEGPDTEATVFIQGMPYPRDGLMAYLDEFFKEALQVHEQ